MAEGYHPYTWVLWLAAATLATLSTRNPLYLVIILLAAGFVFAVLLRRDAGPAAGSAAAARSSLWKPVVRLALFLGLFTLLFNALTVHFGDRILFTLPAGWPVIGGPVTLEAVLYGVSTALSFVALILVFTVFNSAVGTHNVLRMVPAFAYHAGVALTIALSFIPQTLVAWQELREAQRLRGVRVRGLADVQPLMVSLLAIGLDRAIQLAESMDARGFGGVAAPAPARERRLLSAGTILALLLLLTGLLLRTFRLDRGWGGLVLMAAGALVLAVVFRRQGRRIHRTHYRRWLWRQHDTLVAGGSAVLLVALVALGIALPDALFYYPYPPYPLIPSFQPLLGLLYAVILLPALLLPPAPVLAPDA